ncbi:MAG: hypothetical protein VB049_10680 [Candidatus Pelethousia sp.]|nr:hypothetical protein [Candidatus Pelethousia sp.]
MQKVQGWMSQTAMLFVFAIFLIHPLFIDSNLYSAITNAKQSFFIVCAILFFSLTVSGFYRRFAIKELSISIL